MTMTSAETLARSFETRSSERQGGSFRPPAVLMPLLAAFFALLSTASLWAQETEVEFAGQLAAWQATIQQAEQALSTDFEGSDPGEVERDLRRVVSEAESLRARVDERLSPLRQQLDSLGPAPEEGEDPEEESIAELRRDLRSQISGGEAQKTQANLMRVRANELIESVASWQQTQRRQEILQHNPPPVSLTVWRSGGQDAMTLFANVISAPLAWWQERVEAEENPWEGLLMFMGVPILGFLFGWPARRWISKRFGRDPETEDPTYARRIVAAIGDGLANAVMPAAILGLAVLVLSFYDLLTGLFATLIYASALSLAGFLIITGLARASLSPHLTAWRILPVQPGSVWALLYAIRAIAAVMALSFALLVVAFASGNFTIELESIFFLIQTTALSALVVWALSPRYWVSSVEVSQSVSEVEEGGGDAEAATQAAEAVENGRDWLDTARGLVRFSMLFMPLIALFGYSRLAYFLQSRIILTAAMISFALLAYLAAREFIERLLHADHRYLRYLPFRARQVRGYRPAERSEGGAKLTLFWLSMLAGIIIAVPLVYTLLLLWGVPPAVLQLWTLQLLTGIRIGGITISLFDIFAALTVLLLGLFLTGIFRRWLANKVLPNTKLDYGARNSVASGASYLGVGLALLMAISTLGVDFSNLALVAGALSVGIGFGLRTVVENFVAGLLILIERPIKVGDWIIVGGTEGTVKHISVRSTEIETFDRSSVIVPNSDLISMAVTNWTHKNRMARLIIPVGVAYGSDTEKVTRTLLACAAEHPDVLKVPPASAFFMAFGDSSLDFQLRCFVRDTDVYLSAKSDLHFAIDRAFRKEGIEVPFPQQDIHVRSGLHERPWDGRRPTSDEWHSGAPGDSGEAATQSAQPSVQPEEPPRRTPGASDQRSELGEGGSDGADSPDGPDSGTR